MLQSDIPTEGEIKAEKITMPSGGGSIRGVGESFQTNPFSGAGSFSIPLPITPARGFEPKLTLEYNSGNGNSEFGLGFSLALGKIYRRTDTGIPTYTAEDRFAISGEGQLTPKLIERDGQWVEDVQPRTIAGIEYQVLAFLPRKLTSYALVEQFTEVSTGDIHWQMTSTDNVVTVYGKSQQARISDPEDSFKILEWLIESSTDAKGNIVAYQYKEEDGENLHVDEDSNRPIGVQKYIHGIQYGNYFNGDQRAKQSFAFEIIFDYGEYSLADLSQPNSNPYEPVQPWAERSDPYSSYRSGFEIRTWRLCRNILLFHHFPELGQAPCLVSALRLNGSHSPIFSFINEVTRTGYRIKPDGSYASQDSPTLALGYSQFNPSATSEFRPLGIDGIYGTQSIPGYLDQSGFVPINLNGESLPGLFYSNAQTAMYYEPMGDGQYQPPKLVSPIPVTHDLKNPNLTLKSLDGNGQLSLVVDTKSKSGYYDRHYDGSWSEYQSFQSLPTELMNAAGENVDLEGNGKTGWVMFQQPQAAYYPSAGKVGYRKAEFKTLPEQFPAAVHYGELQLVTFANIFGDGLSHRVRVRDGSVDVWPCLGRGLFGDKVTLTNSPRFGQTTQVSRIFFADVDGSGTADLIFVYAKWVEVYLNQSGNSFADEAIKIDLPEGFTDLDKIQFVDVLGSGTTALLLTKTGPNMRHLYHNFCGVRQNSDAKQPVDLKALKPYLLTKLDNNLGAVNEIFYASSTQFFLQDKHAGKPWVTKLPFPVQVVEKTISTDLISGSRTTQIFAYHEGYYDFAEKSFRGFGFIESWDTETFTEYSRQLDRSEMPCDRLDQSLYVPPKYSKTWHHVGAFFENGLVSKQYQSMYYHGDADAYDFPDSVLSESVLNSEAQTIRQAYAALQGTLMRQEVYALDDGPSEANPYTVTQANVEVSLVQPKAHQRYAVFAVNPREKITYDYERNPHDPRVTQEFTLAVDPHSGKPEKVCTVYLPRRQGHGDEHPEQHMTSAMASHNNYINTNPDEADHYRGVPLQEQEFEILGLALNGQSYFSYSDIEPVAQAVESPIPYQSPADSGTLQARQLSWRKSIYWNEAQTEALPFGQISSRALHHHSATAVFPQSFVNEVFGGQLTDETLSDEGGYVYDESNGYWWNNGLTQFYGDGPETFYLPNQTENTESGTQLFTKSTIEYDQPYHLTPVKSTEYLSDSADNNNVVTAAIDYVTLKPYQEVDINDNVTQVLFDPLGQVIVSSTFGSENGVTVGGMRLYPYAGQPAEYVLQNDATFSQVLTESEKYLQGASHYFYYNLLAWNNQQPACSIDLTRTDFYQQSGSVTAFSCQTTINFSDGFARALETKVKTSPGLAISRDAAGRLEFDDNHNAVEVLSEERWMVSGRTVYNNKNEPCEQYLAYFSNTPEFETQAEIYEQHLVPPPTVTHYDPLKRVIRVDSPKGFFSRREFTSWEEKFFDEDDTVTESPYYICFMENYPDNPTKQQQDEKDALEKAAVFTNTPEIKTYNNVGHVFQTVQLMADQRPLIAYSKPDIQGRVEEIIDPRLYASNVTHGTDYFSFKYRYSMGKDAPPVRILSADCTAPEKQLKNIFGNLFWSLSPRNYCQLIAYDALQRKSTLQVKKLASDEPITTYDDFNLVEIFKYGESAENSQQYNLRGQLNKLYDLSGLLTNTQFNLLGKIQRYGKQMAKDYKTAIDYNQDPLPELEPALWVEQTHDALDHVITQTTPDGSITRNGYNPAGLLKQVHVQFKDEPEKPVVELIEYDAKGQRKQVLYGNAITTEYSYEDTTQRLIKINSHRLETQAIQDVDYTYDPVGNITRSRNNTFQTVFNNNQAVEPLSEYTYDALYRLIDASGRQHPGITANTYKNNQINNDFKQSLFSQLPGANDQDKLENYHRSFRYDDSGNLIEKQHQAVSASWSREMPVEDDCNRLTGLEYDASGNQRQLAINNLVNLSFNCCENLVKACIIERPEELDDCDYYVYDSNEVRTRKVVERFASGGAVTLIEEKTYLGNYEIKRVISVDAEGTQKTLKEQQTLRVMDDANCILIAHLCVIGEQAGSRTWRYQLSNNLGSISSEWSEEAKLISYEEYYPYGGTAIIAGSNQTEVKQKVYRYSGKERDDSTGLYYYGARYYAPWLGRWMKLDPAGTVDGLNLYAFVNGNPISFNDKTGLSASSNKYEWEVRSSTNFVSSNVQLNNILDNFGEPTSTVVKLYDDLASRVGYDVSHNSGKLQSSTVTDLHLMFDATEPLHLGFNDLLGDEWRDNMDSYGGGQRMKKLYTVMRSKTTQFFKSETSIPSFASLNDVLYAVSNRPPEVHHILYKAVRPQYANQTSNLMLVQRSERESVFGPGQHELMHMVGSGNSSNKFSVLLPQFETEYINWYQAKQSVTTMQVSKIQ